MPALYIHVPRLTGELITDVDYNDDHINHVINGEAAQLGGYSVTVAQMQTVEDPGGVGTESLPSSIAGELTRVRHRLWKIVQWLDPAATFWYSPLPAAGSWSSEIATMKRTALYTDDTKERLDTLGVVAMNATNGQTQIDWVNGVFTILRAWWRVPEHWTPGTDITIIWWMTANLVDGNTAKMGYDVWRHRLGIVPSPVGSGTVDLVPANLNTSNVERVIAAANIQVGDLLYFHFNRDGGHAGDTHTGTINHSGTMIKYTANAGQI